MEPQSDTTPRRARAPGTLWWTFVIAGAVLVAAALPLFAQQGPSGVATEVRAASDSGDRVTLAERGITTRFDWTNYYQGLMSGTGDKEWEYGGRLDSYTTLDAEKLGWWKEGVLRFRGEYRYGSLPSNLDGALLSTNVGMLLPTSGDDTPELTEISLLQKLSGNKSLIIGKINTLDLLANDPFYGGGESLVS